MDGKVCKHFNGTMQYLTRIEEVAIGSIYLLLRSDIWNSGV